MEFLYWHWLLLGVALLVIEVIIPSFTVFWFGLGALVVGLVLWVAPGLPLAWQLLILVVASSIFAFLWFKYLKPRMIDRTNAGIAREAAIGESGQVIKVPVYNGGSEGGIGRVRFTTPILGGDEWAFRCEQPVALGDKVYIKEIAGNTLVVVKLN